MGHGYVKRLNELEINRKTEMKMIARILKIALKRGERLVEILPGRLYRKK